MMREKLARYGQWTYRGAWAIEIVAAILGLVTGIALGWQGYTASESGTAFDFVLQSAPFFMVALAELTKIPIATLLFAAPLTYKPVLLVFLAGLAFITFETVFTGLERAAALRQLHYEELLAGVRLNQRELSGLENEASQLLESDLTTDARMQYDSLYKQFQSERKVTLEELDRIQNQLSKPPALAERIQQTEGRLDEERIQLDKLLDRRDAEIDRERNAFERQRKSYTDRIEEARKNNDKGYLVRMQRELERLRNPVPAIRKRYENQIAGKQNTVNSYEKVLNNLRKQIPSTNDPKIQNQINRLEQRLIDIEGKWQPRLDSGRDRVAEAQVQDAQNVERLRTVRTRISTLNTETNTLEQERVPLARTDQVRRIAARFFGVNPENVNADQADLVAVIWFGSLAALAALTGPLTAMVALGLQILADKNEKRRESKFLRSLRRLIVNWRFRRTKTKVVEVPVEKPIKEIFYVPILTDDPELVRGSLVENVPEEIADLVSVKMADKSGRQVKPKPKSDPDQADG